MNIAHLALALYLISCSTNIEQRRQLEIGTSQMAIETRSQTRIDGVEAGGKVVGLGNLRTENLRPGIHKPKFKKERVKPMRRVGTSKTNFGCLRYEREGDQLLPGIPNEITLDLVSTKLPWTSFPTLSSVGSSWHEAIESHQVHNARGRSHSTETLVVINHVHSDCDQPNYGSSDCGPSNRSRWIALYSLKDGKLYRLPKIPHYEFGIPHSCQCISLGGKIYVLGGMLPRSGLYHSNRVYVIDLAGQNGWERCANMKSKRINFGCGVHHGKIYVCGGYSKGGYTRVPEVYDPALNVWSPIKSMKSMRVHNQVSALGDEILVHGGRVYKQYPPQNYMWGASFSEVYNPVSDKWRKADEQIDRYGGNFMFTSQGKIYTLRKRCILGYDPHTKSWTDQHCLCPLGSTWTFERATPLAVDNEVVLHFHTNNYESVDVKHLFLQSIGFESKSKMIEWRRIGCPFPLVDKPFICAVQL